MVAESENSGKSLLERIGGLPFLKIVLNSLYDELLESPELEPFFRHAPIETIKTHQSVLFRIVLGSKTFNPTQDQLINYMLASHSRLFRDKGLNEAHFDLVVGCLVISLQSFLVDKCLIDEIVSVIAPLRAVFEYGAKVATSEKKIGLHQRQYLPPCSAATIGTDTLAILPQKKFAEEPSWLREEFKKVTGKTSLRDWTCKLSDRCSATGDEYLADVMMDIPIFQLKEYMSSFVQLAFLPDNIEDSITAEIIKKLRYPRGYGNEPLSRSLFDRMVKEFAKTCDQMDVKRDDKKILVEKLRTFRKTFSKGNHSRVNGASNPSTMLADDIQDTTANLPEDTSYSPSCGGKIEQAKRSSVCSNTSFSFNDAQSFKSSASPQKKSGISKWFGIRKLWMNMNPSV